MYGYIYITKNLINNKVYIGQHKSTEYDSSYIGSGKLLLNAVRKYSRSNFTNELIECCNSKQALDEREKYWINYYNSTNNQIGYNIAYGGEGGDIFTQLTTSQQEELKLIYSQSVKGKICINNSLRNKYICKEDLQNYIALGWSVGALSKHSEEFKVKVSSDLKNRISITNGTINKRIKPEQLQEYLNKGFYKGWTNSSKRIEYQELKKQEKNEQCIKELELWISEKHVCEKCGKVMTVKYGSGRFCSKKCASIHNHTQETKDKISLLNKQGICGFTNKPLSSEHKNKISKKLTEFYKDKRIWITNGIVSTRIKESELQEYLKQGFIRGRKTQNNTFSAWNKGLDKSDERVAINIERRNNTMLERYGTLDGNKFRKKIRH